MVTAVIAPSRAPFTPSRPAIAPDGTRMRQPCFSASAAHPSSTPTSAPTESTIRCLPAESTAGPNSRSAAWVAASTIRSARSISPSRASTGYPAAVAGRRTLTPTSVVPGMPRVSASATRRPITPIPTIPIFSMRSSFPPRERRGDDSSGRRGRTRDRARISAEDDCNAPAPGAARAALPRGRRAAGLVHGLRARGSVRPVGRLGARPHGGVARALRAGLRSGQAHRALRGLPLPVQPPARSGRLLPRYPAGPDPARLARRRVPRRLLARGSARGRGPGALRGLLPDPGSLRGLSAQPALVRVPSLVPARVHRRRVQADAALPSLDGASGGARLRALDRDPARRTPHSGGHPHREHGPLAGSHPAAQPELEDDGGDHERTAPARSGRSGEVRLLALPHPDVRAVPRPPRRDRVRPVPAAAGVPPLARATECCAVTAGWVWVVVAALALLLGVTAWALWRAVARLGALETARQQPDQALLLLQRDIQTARAEAHQARSETLATVKEELHQFASHMTQQMGQVGSGVQQQLQHVGQVVGAVQGSLGKLGEVTQRVFD